MSGAGTAMGHLGNGSSPGLSVPQLKPILADIEYLQDQHLLLTVKSMDGYESYGEGQEVPGGTRNQVAPQKGLTVCWPVASTS